MIGAKRWTIHCQLTSTLTGDVDEWDDGRYRWRFFAEEVCRRVAAAPPRRPEREARLGIRRHFEVRKVKR